MTPFVTMRWALSDTHLLGAALGDDSWLAWRILLIAAMGRWGEHRRAVGGRRHAVARLSGEGAAFPKIIAAALALEERGMSLSGVRLAEAPWGELVQGLDGRVAQVDGQLVLSLEGSDVNSHEAFAGAEAYERAGNLEQLSRRGRWAPEASAYSRPRSRTKPVAWSCKYEHRLFRLTDPQRTAVRRRYTAMDQAHHARLQPRRFDGREAQTKPESDAN
ncbi:MAG: hypothetical protein WA397_16350 [Roseiarcus sp.]